MGRIRIRRVLEEWIAMRFHEALATLATLAALLATPASAELDSTMTALIVTPAPDGTETYRPATSARPGETVEYRIEHRNGFSHALDGVAVVGPIPDEMELVVARASADIPAMLEVRGEFDPDSVGEEWSALPATKIVVDAATGLRMVEDATEADFTAVRWRLDAPLPASGTVRHVYRAQVK